MAAPVAGYEYPYFYRFAQSVAGTGASYNLFQTRLEDVRTFAGQTVTISFWGKAAATTSIVKLNLEQEFGTGGSPSATVSTDIAGTNFSLTTSWQRFTVTTTVPSIAGKTIGTTTPGFLGLRVWIPVNATFTLDFFGFQIESGSTATAFQTASGTITGELALCQRYFYNGGNTIGSMNTSGNALFIQNLPVPMRTTPSMSFTGTATVIVPGVATYTTTTQPSGISQTQLNNAQIYFNMSGLGSTVASGVAYSSSLIALSAEL
jgi:hypothetical protein